MCVCGGGPEPVVHVVPDDKVSLSHYTPATAPGCPGSLQRGWVKSEQRCLLKDPWDLGELTHCSKTEWF